MVRTRQDSKALLTSALTAGAVVILTWSGVLDGFTRAWWSGLLVNGGVAVLLVAPIYVFNKRLDTQIAQARAEASARDDLLAERVAAIEDDVTRRIEDLAAAVDQRITRERDHDATVFGKVAAEPSRAVLLEALRRADELGLISERRGPRVLVSASWDLFVRFEYEPADEVANESEGMYFIVEHSDGIPLESVGWYPEMASEDVLVQLGRAIQKHSSPVITLGVKSMFLGLSNLLEVAARSARFRPILQLCPPQWVVTMNGIISYDRFAYELRVAQLRRADITQHMATKPWLDLDSFDGARLAALELLNDDPF